MQKGKKKENKNEKKNKRKRWKNEFKTCDNKSKYIENNQDENNMQ